MNASPTNPTDFTEEHVDGSDSDPNIDEDDAPEYYQNGSQISVLDESNSENSEPINSNGYEAYGGDQNDAVEYHPSSQLSNGHHIAENGMSSLDLNNDAEQSNSISKYEEGEEMTREAPDSEIMRAFREDENRRNAPLTPESAMRIREAMGGISLVEQHLIGWSEFLKMDRSIGFAN